MKMFKYYLMEQLDSQYLKEGLISSYDTETMVEKIKNIISLKISRIEGPNVPPSLQKTKYGNIFTTNIYLKEPLSIVEDNKINKILNIYGYTNSIKMFDKLSLQLEPKYPVKMNKIIESKKNQILYHFTRKLYLNKIKEIGLIPKLSQTSFDHPDDRIYFMWLPYSNEIKTTNILNSVKNMLAKNKEIRADDMALLFTKYDPNKNYYLDDTTTVIDENILGIFTTNNISPKDITIL